MFKNNSTRAKTIFQDAFHEGISAGRQEVFSPQNRYVLQMVVEMGLQKIRSDHIFALQGKHVSDSEKTSFHKIAFLGRVLIK